MRFRLVNLAFSTFLLATAFVAVQPAAEASASWGTYLCNQPSYACATGGYDGHDPWGYWHYSSYNSYGPHNCTAYAAFKEAANGVPNPGNLGDATTWATNARKKGIPVNGTPAVGAIAQFNSGHVAYVEEVGSGYIITTDDSYHYENSNYGNNTTKQKRTPSQGWPDNFIHFKDLSGGGGGSAPPPVGFFPTQVHSNRVLLRWATPTGATHYQVFRDGALVADAASAQYLDTQVSKGQNYHYQVTALNAAGASPSADLWIRIGGESANDAYLQSRWGPTECGLAGDQRHQAVVCNVLTDKGWVGKTSQFYDWGYATDRAFFTNADGSVSYCRRVGTGNVLTCDIFTPSGWSKPQQSPAMDAGYTDASAPS